MATTQTTTVATISANAGGRRNGGEIRRDGSRYLVVVNGRTEARVGSLGSAAHRLAEGLRRDLRPRDPNWGVLVRCSLRDDVSLAFGNEARGPGGGAPSPCVGKVIRQYGHGDNSLARALEFAAKLLADCCG
jgi:hypothetical protein